MLLGSKTKKELYTRHVIMALISATLVYGVWLINATWSPDMRLWKAFGGGAFALLWFTVFIGPASLLWKPLMRLISWRREAGIWFAIIIAVHTYLILDGWARWSVAGFFGFQYIQELGMYVRVEPGFGLANTMGLVAVILALILAATSSDRAVNYLGVSSWKWLHSFAYVIFYLGALHVLYFAFIHYVPSLAKLLSGAPAMYPVNPLRFVYVFAFASVFIVQMVGFIKTLKKHSKKSSVKSVSQKGISTKIENIKKIAKGTYEISFIRPEGFNYTPGQYMEVSLPHMKTADPKGNFRVFSLTSEPQDTKTLSVAFRNTKSEYKKALIAMKKGDEVVLDGPFGHFILPEKTKKKHIFIAGGIGIAPFMSMIKSVVKQKYVPNITLVYGNRDEESIAYKKELELLSKQSENISLELVIGHITQEILSKYIETQREKVWWIVGPPQMVVAVKQTLLNIGVHDEDIRVEEFTGY